MNRQRQLAIALVALTSVVATAMAGAFIQRIGANPQPQPIVIRMRRTCERCPNYAISLASDGHLTYEGLDRVRVAGVRESTLDPWTTAQAIHDFIQSGFYDLEKSYPSPGKHMIVSMSIEMSGTGMSKIVESEDRYGPLLIIELEHLFDDLPGMRDLSGWAY